MIARRMISLSQILAVLALVSVVAGCARFYDRRDDTAQPAAQSYRTPKAKTRDDVVFTPVPPPGAHRVQIPASGYHSVVRGNTVYSVSRLYGVPVREIIEANGIRPPYLLKVGDKLRLSAPRTHTVRKGETVYSISRRYNVGMDTLTRANRIGPPYTISVGQKLVIPAGAAKPAKPRPVQVAGKAQVPALPPTPKPKPAGPKTAASLPKPPPRTGKLFSWPVSGKVLASFGSQSGGRHNDGINIKARRGDTVTAAESGVVAYAGHELRGFGNLLLIKHADGYMTAYAHNETLLVERGEKVRRGQAIAKVGSSGSVGEPQLHFEIRKGRKAVDPMRYLAKTRRTSS